MIVRLPTVWLARVPYSFLEPLCNQAVHLVTSSDFLLDDGVSPNEWTIVRMLRLAGGFVFSVMEQRPAGGQDKVRSQGGFRAAINRAFSSLRAASCSTEWNHNTMSAPRLASPRIRLLIRQ